ncbi:hypothetical protein [Bradyrhizobium archetypum]|uniref:Uncharacterized protein n=1 Tax=Bradyrhizobium archetypum TaxID=2721160 RepID=A0A7Y4H9M2_9BRAD|nr:hypothetical protein [Bradyrhizobium archetypum]NOJ50215.1 hypothetical protein [Bradyrhizobium archetypum]
MRSEPREFTRKLLPASEEEADDERDLSDEGRATSPRHIVPKPLLGERQRHPRSMLPSVNRRDRTQKCSVYGIDLD